MSPYTTHHKLPLSALVVDDLPSVRDLLVRFLRQLHIRACMAASGLEAIELLRAHQETITLAFVDIHMPGLNGLATVQALQQIKPSLRCCIITGGSLHDEEADVCASGALPLLYKPFHLEDLGVFLQQILKEPLAECSEAP